MNFNTFIDLQYIKKFNTLFNKEFKYDLFSLC